MKFKLLFIIFLFACAALIGAGLGFARIYLDSTVKPTITLPETVTFSEVSKDYYDYIDYSADTSFTLTGYIRLDRSILLNCYDQFNDAFHCQDILGDFKSLTTHLTTTVSAFDGTFSGEGNVVSDKEFPYCGKGYYNAPDLFADVITHSAINVFSMATAHVNDGGYDGVVRTRKTLRKYSSMTVGIADKKANKFEYEDFEQEGIKIRIYSTTEKVNRPIHGAYPYSVNTLTSEDDLKKLAKSVKNSKDALVDIVVCAVYFDNKGNGIVTNNQRNIMKALLDAGADVVYGTNPDIVEPMEVRTKKMKSGKDKYQFGIYSLGCLLSGAKGNLSGIPKNAGLVAKFSYDQDNVSTYFTDVSFSPTYCVSYPTVDDFDTAGEHVKVFAMNNVIDYLNDGGSTKSTVKVTKPAVNHPFKADDPRYMGPVATTEEATTEELKRRLPSTTEPPATTEEITTEASTTEEATTEVLVDDLFPTGFISRISGLSIIKANAVNKEDEYIDSFYTDNLTKSDFNTIKSAYYNLPKRLFSGTNLSYYEKDGWFYIKK
ncbi:MAG: CapA family protein [Lachnospiraceae bacterium]|nr:CapA family protein [Lachnospiraceae bacterium]